jgi:hypothetical protein
MQDVLEWIWFVGGVCSCLAALRPGPDRWRNIAFGFSLVVYVLVDRLSGPVPTANASPGWPLRMAALDLQGLGFLVVAPTLAKGRFEPDRALAQEFGIACFLWIFWVSLAYELGPPQVWWMLWIMPLTLWPVLLVPAWFRRLHQRGLHLELAAASLACVAVLAFGIVSSVWPELSFRPFLPSSSAPLDKILHIFGAAG